MRVEERHIAAIALVACLFLPYHASISQLLAPGWSLLLVLGLALVGGPFPLLSSAACAVVAILMFTNPRGAFWPAICWLALWCVGFLLFAVFQTGRVPWWPWAWALLAGVWTRSVAVRAPQLQDRRTDLSVFD